MSLPRSPDHDLQRLLGDDHGEFGTLYRRLARSEPPRRLDRAVLGEAARAVRGRAPRRHRWLVGLGSAAGIVLAAGIAWRVGQEAAMQPSAITVPAPAAVEIVPVQPIREQARRPAEPAPAAESFADDSAAAPAPAGAARREAAADAAKQRAKPAPRKPIAPPPPLPVVEQAPPAPAPAPFPQAQEATVAGEADASARGERAGAPAGKSATAGERESAPERQRARAAPAPSASVELRRDQQLAPDAWLAQVRDLLRQGRHQQAAESLRLFHRTHPRHAVPEDLRSLLE